MTIESIDVKVIISQIFILFLLALAGYISAKTKHLPEETGLIIAKLVMRLTMPMTILSKMLGTSFNGQDYIDGVKLYILAIVFLSISLGVSILVTTPLKIEETTKNIYKIQSMFGNVMFFAFPLFLALFGEKGIVYALFFNMGNDTFLWTIGIYLANKHKESNFKSNFKHLLNINTIVFGIGLILMFTGFSAWIANISTPVVKISYGVFYKTVEMIGSTTSPLSMIFIGMILAKSNIRELLDFKKKYPLFILSFQKLIFVPIIALGILYFTRSWFSDLVIMIAVLQIAMPAGTTTASIAADAGSDYRYATEGIFLTTVLCLGTLPFVALLLKIMF